MADRRRWKEGRVTEVTLVTKSSSVSDSPCPHHPPANEPNIRRAEADNSSDNGVLVHGVAVHLP
jgi:hypothetical protein